VGGGDGIAVGGGTVGESVVSGGLSVGLCVSGGGALLEGGVSGTLTVGSDVPIRLAVGSGVSIGLAVGSDVSGGGGGASVDSGGVPLSSSPGVGAGASGAVGSLPTFPASVGALPSSRTSLNVTVLPNALKEFTPLPADTTEKAINKDKNVKTRPGATIFLLLLICIRICVDSSARDSVAFPLSLSPRKSTLVILMLMSF
jgi:hypothetical protein